MLEIYIKAFTEKIQVRYDKYIRHILHLEATKMLKKGHFPDFSLEGSIFEKSVK